jgi:hypothetical protein
MRVGKIADLVLPRNPGGNVDVRERYWLVTEKPRQKRGCPRKILADAPIDTIKEQFATENIAATVDSKHRHKPSAQKMSPQKSPGVIVIDL